jgi:MFS family permease
VDDQIRGRRLALATYVTAVALTSIAYIATFQNASIAAPHITGIVSTAGLPSSAAVGGTALAAALLSGLMAARGRRAGIVAGIVVAVVGSMLTFAAILAWSFPLLLVGAGLTGFGNAAVALSRYAAADLYPSGARGSAVGIVVWGSTVGAVLGPNLVAPANAVAAELGVDRFAGGFAMAVGFMALALAAAAFGPRAPVEAAAPADVGAAAPGAPGTPLLQLLAALFVDARGRMAVLALISGQLVMVLIMTMTPYQLDHAGHGDTVVGIVISAHVLGMFALSPVSGRLTDRYGAVAVIMGGFGLLALAGVLAAAAPAEGGVALMVPLFLLGFGWNLGFVAGSSLLASGAGYADRARTQGLVDALVWGTSAFAGVLAGIIVAGPGFSALSLGGAALAVVLAAIIAVDGRASRSAAA